MKLLTPFVLSMLAVAGCATTGAEIDAESGSATAESLPPAADRQAILALAGEFKVGFAFDETVALQPGYDRREAKRSGADEVVIVVEDSGDKIMLQHLLIVGDGVVIKHWRQDWIWEAGHRLEFSDDQTWRRVELPADKTQLAWTQCVYGVADTPRYCGTGKWNHRYGHATWTSDRTWRPLPRREYTTREDYNALNVENRHTITPDGWTHEQDNSKVVRVDGRTEQVLVREFGFNDYVRNPDFDFTPAYDYWDETAQYWARVRETWQNHIDAGGLALATGVDGMPIIEGLFNLADQVRSGTRHSEVNIEQVFHQFVRPLGQISVAGN